MQGHRQNFVEVHINEIVVNGKSFKADEPAAEAKAEKKPAKKAAKKTKPQRNSRKGTDRRKSESREQIGRACVYACRIS